MKNFFPGLRADIAQLRRTPRNPDTAAIAVQIRESTPCVFRWPIEPSHSTVLSEFLEEQRPTEPDVALSASMYLLGIVSSGEVVEVASDGYDIVDTYLRGQAKMDEQAQLEIYVKVCTFVGQMLNNEEVAREAILIQDMESIDEVLTVS